MEKRALAERLERLRRERETALARRAAARAGNRGQQPAGLLEDPPGPPGHSLPGVLPKKLSDYARHKLSPRETRKQSRLLSRRKMRRAWVLVWPSLIVILFVVLTVLIVV